MLKGVYSVRKGKSQLHKWAERQVILCGTCLIVASVKDSLTGKMHILPLVGGKVGGSLLQKQSCCCCCKLDSCRLFVVVVVLFL